MDSARRGEGLGRLALPLRLRYAPAPLQRQASSRQHKVGEQQPASTRRAATAGGEKDKNKGQKKEETTTTRLA
jgi:hypothetical protein